MAAAAAAAAQQVQTRSQPAQGSHASQALSLKLKEDLSGTGPSLSTAWMPRLLWEKNRKNEMNEGWLVTWLLGWMPQGFFFLVFFVVIANQATKWLQGFFLETEN